MAWESVSWAMRSLMFPLIIEGELLPNTTQAQRHREVAARWKQIIHPCFPSQLKFFSDGERCR